MKWWSNIPLFIGCFNLFARLIYTTIGSKSETEIELNGLVWVFYIIPPIYVIASGVLSFLAIILSIIFMISKKSVLSIGILAIAINIIYIILYLRWMSIQ